METKEARLAAIPKALSFDPASDRFYILDQTRLPTEEVVEEQTDVEQVYESIYQLKVRGAPAIGIAGAYGLLISLKEHRDLDRDAFEALVHENADYLNGSRPTAVNLSWALKRMVGIAEAFPPGESTAALYAALRAEAMAIHESDIETCRLIGEYGAELIEEGSGVMTLCNAGALATGGIGTALAPMYVAWANGKRFRAYSNETRPLLQGARITSWELHRFGIDVTLIADSVASYLMKLGKVDLIIVGADRVAANGDTANKIGTSSLAINARHYGVPFYIACPYSTIDPHTPTGEEIVVEERGANEVIYVKGQQIAPADIQVFNPAFDVTDHELIAGFITEKGIIRPPYNFSA